MMRDRLKKLVDFLQQLLDDKGFDFRNLSADLREVLQRSIDQSRLLSQSISVSLDQSVSAVD